MEDRGVHQTITQASDPEQGVVLPPRGGHLAVSGDSVVLTAGGYHQPGPAMTYKSHKAQGSPPH